MLVSYLSVHGHWSQTTECSIRKYFIQCKHVFLWRFIYIVANGTETVAVSQGNDKHKLYGYKWFTSATDADMALTLAREQDDKGNTIPVCSIYAFTFLYL